MYALLDDGLNVTLLDMKVATNLGLSGEPRTLCLTLAGGREEEFPSMKTSVELQSRDGRSHGEIDVTAVPEPARGIRAFDWCSIKHRWSHLDDVDVVHMDSNKKIEMIIGQDQAHLLMSLEDRDGDERGPVARRGPLGWTISGPTSGGDAKDKIILSKPSKDCPKALEILPVALNTNPTSSLFEDEDGDFDPTWKRKRRSPLDYVEDIEALEFYEEL